MGPSWIRFTKDYTLDQNFLRYRLAIPLRYYGIEPNSTEGQNKPPWDPQNNKLDPTNRALAEKIIIWSQSWNKFLDIGIRNQLLPMLVEWSKDWQIPGKATIKNTPIIDTKKRRNLNQNLDFPRRAQSPTSRLRKLKDLFDAGLISEDEYQEKKKEILSEM